MTDDGTFPCPIKWTQQSTLSNFVGTLLAKGIEICARNDPPRSVPGPFPT